MVENKEVDATSIRVETLNGTVMLSGFAKNATEKTTAEAIARKVNGVKSDLDVVAGHRDQLAGKIRERYGIAKDEAEKQLAAWERKATDSWFTKD